MEKNKKKKYVRIITEYHPVFKEGEICLIIRKFQNVVPDEQGQYIINQRRAWLSSLNKKKIGWAREGLDYELIDNPPAIDVLYGIKEEEVQPESKYIETEHGKINKYKVKRNRGKV